MWGRDERTELAEEVVLYARSVDGAGLSLPETFQEQCTMYNVQCTVYSVQCVQVGAYIGSLSTCGTLTKIQFVTCLEIVLRSPPKTCFNIIMLPSRRKKHSKRAAEDSNLLLVSIGQSLLPYHPLQS